MCFGKDGAHDDISENNSLRIRVRRLIISAITAAAILGGAYAIPVVPVSYTS